jgi:phosphoribosylamine--glycine ligase
LPVTDDKNSKVFHASTKQVGDDLVTAGGRVLCACALGDNIQTAQINAYALASKIHWNAIYYRTDIGFKAIK